MYKFYKELYEREQDLRIAYDNRVDFTITLTVAIATADAFLCNSIAPWTGTLNVPLFLFTCVTLLSLFIVHIVFVYRSYASLRFRYRDFPVDMIAPDIKNHLLEYAKLHPTANMTEIETEYKRYVPLMLEITYRYCATEYYRENIRRRTNHFYLNLTSIINVIAVITFYVIIYISDCFF